MKSEAIPLRRAFLPPILILSALAAILFIPAGSLLFWQGCLYWSWFAILTLFITVYFYVNSPDLLQRRTKIREQRDTRKPPAFLNLFWLCYIIPGLDFRWHWSSVPLWLVISANTIAFLGYLFVFYVLRENRYASTVIQVEDGQQLITGGPYAIARHPMYSGLIVLILFTPLALGSYWAVLPALLCIPLNVYRIRSEEAVLSKQLNGYQDYCRKTPYRLFPYVW